MEVRLTGTSSTPPATCRGIGNLPSRRFRPARRCRPVREIRPGGEGVGVHGSEDLLEKPNKNQINSTREGLQTAVTRGLAVKSSRDGVAVYSPLPTDGWQP